MSRTSTIILLGFLTILAPFSGLPIGFRTLLQVIFGACVLGIGLALRAEEAKNAHAHSEPPPEVNTPPSSISPI